MPPREMSPNITRLRRTVRHFYRTQESRKQAAHVGITVDPDTQEIVTVTAEPLTGKKKKKKAKKKATKSALRDSVAGLIEVLKGSSAKKAMATMKEAEEHPFREGPTRQSFIPADLEEEDRLFVQRQALTLLALEADILIRIEDLLEQEPFYMTWLRHQRGVGPTLAGVILAEVDIHRCETVSQLWAYAGMRVDPVTGRAVSRKRGEKLNYNPFLKAKFLFVLGGCLLKANSPYRVHYDDYRHRKKHQLVGVCMACEGKGEAKPPNLNKEEAVDAKNIRCWNCNGTGGPAPWGRSDAHRHQAAVRYMVKMFMLDMWKAWRELENLPVTEPYSVAKLNLRHGDHAPNPHMR